MFSDKIFIVHVYALEISCLCPFQESEISENDTSDFRLPQILLSVWSSMNITLFVTFLLAVNKISSNLSDMAARNSSK